MAINQSNIMFAITELNKLTSSVTNITCTKTNESSLRDLVGARFYIVNGVINLIAHKFNRTRSKFIRCEFISFGGENSRLLVNLDSRTDLTKAFSLYKPSRNILKFLVSIAQFLLRKSHYFSVLNGFSIFYDKQSNLQNLSNCVNVSAILSVYVGTPTIDRKIVVLHQTGSEVKALKFGSSNEAQTAIKLEFQQLQSVTRTKLKNYLPDYRYVQINENKFALETDFIKSGKAKEKLDGFMFEFFLILKTVDTKKHRLSHYPEFSTNSILSAEIKQQMQLLSLERGDLLITHRMHGDLAPWNVISSDDRLWIIDWERSRVGSPLGSDLFYYYLCEYIITGKGVSKITEILAKIENCFKKIYTDLSNPNEFEFYFCFWLLNLDSKHRGIIWENFTERYR